MPLSNPARGALAGLLAAATFGVSAPLAKLLVPQVHPVTLAGLLYLGAGLGLSGFRLLPSVHERREAPLRRRDLLPLAGLVVSGGVVAPVLMLVGLARVSGVVGSLLLNLEAPLTILLALVLFREHLGRRSALAALLVLGGAAVLRFQPGALAADGPGVIALAGACLCWALDNNLTQRLSVRNPFALVRIKTLSAGLFNLLLGTLIGAALPSPRLIAAALALGTVSYGASVVLDAFALRWNGAAREAAFFGTAPFIGAALSVPLLGERLSAADLGAATAMLAGVGLLLTERHSHRHLHLPLEHEHVHSHDVHHQHAHPEGLGAEDGAVHSHPHRHVSLEHEHPHVSDVHHRHGHE